MVKSWSQGRGRKAQAVKSPLGGVWVRAGGWRPGKGGRDGDAKPCGAGDSYGEAGGDGILRAGDRSDAGMKAVQS